MILSVDAKTFGGAMRNGDLIAALNFVEHMRQTDRQQRLFKLYIPDSAIQSSSYVKDFRNYLISKTNYISTNGTHAANMDVSGINLWDYRSVTGDVLKLKLGNGIKNKICIFPLLDAPYNTYRNWSVEMVNKIIDHYMKSEYNDYEKIVCINKPYEFNLQGFRYSHDFIENVNHITECSHYIGGDTGMSHFVSVLDQNERKINYYYGSVGWLHTTPFYALQGKGNINLFWNGNFRTDLL